MSSRHSRPEAPVKANAILHVGARPLPDGTIEMMVLFRLDDCNYQLQKPVGLQEYQVILEGLDLCAKTAVHQARAREVAAARKAAEEPEDSGPPEDSAALPAGIRLPAGMRPPTQHTITGAPEPETPF